MWSGNAAITILPSLQTLPFDPLKDLAPISTSLSMPSIFLVNNDLPVNLIAELIAHAKANPGKLSYGTPGVGTPQHVAGELFCHLAGIRMEHIPYRGANLADVMGGVVPVGIQNAGASLPLVRDGRVRGIGITSLKRSPNAPDLPTFNELGFPGFEATSWFALLGAGRHAAAHHRQGARRIAEGAGRSRNAEEVREPWPRCRRQHIGGDACRHRGRHPQMGSGHQGRQHQAGQLNHGRIRASHGCPRRQRSAGAARPAGRLVAHRPERRRGDFGGCG